MQTKEEIRQLSADVTKVATWQEEKPSRKVVYLSIPKKHQKQISERVLLICKSHLEALKLIEQQKQLLSWQIEIREKILNPHITDEQRRELFKEWLNVG